MIDEIVESLGEATVEKVTGAAKAVVETVGESVELVVGDSVVDIVDMATDVVMPDRQEASEEHESAETESDSEDSET